METTMTSKTLFVLSLITILAQAACAEPQVEQTQPIAEVKAPVAIGQSASATRPDPAELLRNGKMPFEGVLVGGQPTAEQLETLGGLGYGTIVNLRGLQEEGNTDPTLVESLGMQYVSLPISGANDISEQNANKLTEILADSDAPVVVHCASGNRVGALFALKAYYTDGESAEQALAIGKEAGVTRLEPVIKQKLGLE